jgi:hypothetical protein
MIMIEFHVCLVIHYRASPMSKPAVCTQKHSYVLAENQLGRFGSEHLHLLAHHVSCLQNLIGRKGTFRKKLDVFKNPYGSVFCVVRLLFDEIC